MFFNNNSIDTVQIVLREAAHRLQEELELDVESKKIFGIFFDHVDLIVNSDIVTHFRPSDASLSERVCAATTALVLIYGNSMSRFPADFRQGLGETFFGIAGLTLGYLESLQAAAEEHDIGIPSGLLELLELLPTFFLGSEMPRESREFVQRVIENSGARNPVEFLVVVLEKVGVSQQVCTALLKKSDVLMQNWFKVLIAMMEAEG